LVISCPAVVLHVRDATCVPSCTACAAQVTALLSRAHAIVPAGNEGLQTSLNDQSRQRSAELTASAVESFKTAVSVLAVDIVSMLSSPDVEVRSWLSRTGRPVKLAPTVDVFRELVRRALLLPPGPFQLYRFPTAACVIAERMKIHDDASYEALLDVVRTGGEAVVWLYHAPARTDGSAWSSPDTCPVAAGGAVPASPGGPRRLHFSFPAESPVRAAAADGTSTVSSGARSAAQQADFREQLFHRNGRKWQCAACGAENADGVGIEAAHIVRRGATRRELPADVLSPWASTNGFLLCTRCHKHFDMFLWCVRPEEKVEVCNGILHGQDRGLREHFRKINGKTLLFPLSDERGDGWPAASAFAAQAELYERETVRRRRRAATHRYKCGRCGGSWKQEKSLSCHDCDRSNRERHFFTPAAAAVDH